MSQIVEKQNIEYLIYEVRGKQVMLDRDLARLYNVETKVLNQAVKRNIERFPSEFCFQMDNTEFISWRSQFVTLKANGRGNHIKYLPYAFTEHGIMMLSGLLKSNIAAKVNVEIINAFVAMRKYIYASLIEQKYINELVLKDNKRIDLIEKTISAFQNPLYNSSTTIVSYLL